METKNYTWEHVFDHTFFDEEFDKLQSALENENLANSKMSEMPESKTERYQRAEEIAQQIIDESFQKKEEKKEETEEILKKQKRSQRKQDKERLMKLYYEEALETLREILENNRELDIQYERIRRYYAAELFTLKKIREEIKKEGGMMHVCVHFNPDVYPMSEAYEDYYPITKFTQRLCGACEKPNIVKSHYELERLIERTSKHQDIVNAFFDNINAALWLRNPVLNHDDFGDTVQEKYDYVKNFVNDLRNREIEELERLFSMDSANQLKEEYDKWEVFCDIIKKHTLHHTGSTIVEYMGQFFSNFIFECKTRLGLSGGKRKTRRKRHKKRKTRRKKKKKRKTRKHKKNKKRKTRRKKH